MCTEILTPQEKVKAIREQVNKLSETLPNFWTPDDDICEDMLTEAERIAVAILKVIHDANHEDINHAVNYQLTGEYL